MTQPRNFRRLALAIPFLLAGGCGGTQVEPDTAEVIKTEAPKPATPPTPTPEAPPAKDAPKG